MVRADVHGGPGSGSGIQTGSVRIQRLRYGPGVS